MAGTPTRFSPSYGRGVYFISSAEKLGPIAISRGCHGGYMHLMKRNNDRLIVRCLTASRKYFIHTGRWNNLIVYYICYSNGNIKNKNSESIAHRNTLSPTDRKNQRI